MIQHHLIECARDPFLKIILFMSVSDPKAGFLVTMEPPPRLYHYGGLFTSVRSIDLPLKILLILSVLLLLIVIAAWIVSRKVRCLLLYYLSVDI